jgi:hypothetical protein
MRSVINDLFQADLRSRRRKGLVCESQERILTSPSHTSPLRLLGKTSQQVFCPYCKQTTNTRVEQSDSKTTKKVNALLWMGMGDPFALTSHDWCQNTDHFGAKCNGHLAHKPYKGLAQAIPEDSILELPLGSHHEGTEPPADPNRASELYSDSRLTLRHEADQKAAPGSHSPESQGSRNMDPAEMDWGICQASLISHDQASIMTNDQETEPLEPSTGRHHFSAELLRGRPQYTSELKNAHTIKGEPVELDSGWTQSTNPESKSLDFSTSMTATNPEAVPS